MFSFNLRYLVAALSLLIVEVLIALFVRDQFIRPYGGDFLVVILIYCTARSLTNAKAGHALLGALLFSYGVELLQWMRIVDWLGWRDSVIATTIIGYGAEWADMVAYTLGAAAVWLVEKIAAHPWQRLNRQ